MILFSVLLAQGIVPISIFAIKIIEIFIRMVSEIKPQGCLRHFTDVVIIRLKIFHVYIRFIKF